MKKQGIYQTDLGIGNGWIHFGSKNGEAFSQLSFIDIGDMNNDCIKTELDGNQIIITVMLNDMPSSIQIDTETEKGVFDVFSIGFHKDLELQLISDIPAFDNHHIVVPEKINFSLHYPTQRYFPMLKSMELMWKIITISKAVLQ